MDEFVVNDYHGANDVLEPAREYWTVGRLLDPQPEEKLRPFDDERAAINHAAHYSDCYDNEVIAVWDHRDDVVWIFINGMQFCPV